MFLCLVQFHHSEEHFSLHSWLQETCPSCNLALTDNFNLFWNCHVFFKFDGIHPFTLGTKVLADNIFYSVLNTKKLLNSHDLTLLGEGCKYTVTLAPITVASASQGSSACDCLDITATRLLLSLLNIPFPVKFHVLGLC